MILDDIIPPFLKLFCFENFWSECHREGRRKRVWLPVVQLQMPRKPATDAQDAQIFVVKSPDRCAGLVGNYKPKVFFENADSDVKGETTVLQNRMLPSQQKFFDFLGKHISKHSDEYIYCNVGMEHHLFVTSGWSTTISVLKF